MTAIALAAVTDWSGFSRAVRHLCAAGIAPDAVRWQVGDDGAHDLFADDTAAAADALSEAPALRLPASFVVAAREVFLHASELRFRLLHRMAQRIADDARAWADPLHADRLQFDRMQREVRREIHKMHAFVRFRRINGRDVDDRAEGDLFESDAGMADASLEMDDIAIDDRRPRPAATRAGAAPQESSQAGHRRRDTRPPARHVAWFEPAHHVLEAASPFFARRFATMRWAILTPRVSVEWNRQALVFGPGARRADAPGADAGEALWLAYYGSIFNPARVKVAMMKREMPVRFWKNLPEAFAIGPLLAEAPARAARMIAAGGAARDRRRGELDRVAALATDDGSSLDNLRRQAARCRDCPVADAATQTVFGEGSIDARLMIVGEQPGDHEDLRGRPFQGPAGQLLRTAFDELGWDAGELWLTNAVKHFHHELRGRRRLHKTPGQQEAMACLHWLDSEIAVLRPAAIVALGATAARSLLGRDVGVTANAGRWFARADGIPVLVALHPAAILRADPWRQHALRAGWIASLRQAGAHAHAPAPEYRHGLPGSNESPAPSGHPIPPPTQNPKAHDNPELSEQPFPRPRCPTGLAG